MDFNETVFDNTITNRYKMGFSVYDNAREYFYKMQMGVISKADELNIGIVIHNEDANTIEMITGSIDLIAQNINAFIISPFNPEGLPLIVANMKKSDIPVVVIDQGTGGADVDAFIVSDNFGGGILAGEYALRLINERSIISKNAAIINVEATSVYAARRGQGFTRVMVDNGYQIVADLTANSLQDEAYRVMNSILSSYINDLAVVFCENDRMALGAAQAIAEVGKKGEILVIGFDGDSAAITAIKAGFMQGTIAQQPFVMGELGVQVSQDILQDIDVVYDDWINKEIYVEVYLIDDKGEPRRMII